MVGLHGKEIRVTHLPAGLVFHCDDCHVVIPEDAPRPEGGNCAWVAYNRMAPFKRQETLVGQFTMAAAAWGYVYYALLNAPEPIPELADYQRQFRYARKDHFEASALRKAMTAEQLQGELCHPHGRRDVWLYEAR